MKVAGSYSFEVPPGEVWKGLMDPEVLAATMPGCERLELVGENRYEGTLNIKVGPVQGTFQGRVELEEIDPPNGYTMKVDGQGGPGFVKAVAKVEIAAEGEGTLLTYDGDAQVGGRVASVGQRLLDSSAKSIVRQSLEGLNDTLKARGGAAAAGGEGEAAAPAQASQAEFAARVARDVARDLVPKPVWIALLILLAALVLFLILR